MTNLPADLRQHDLRHSLVSVWLAEGKAAQLVHRADLATTMGYAHLVDDDLLQLVERREEVALRALAEG